MAIAVGTDSRYVQFPTSNPYLEAAYNAGFVRDTTLPAFGQTRVSPITGRTYVHGMAPYEEGAYNTGYVPPPGSTLGQQGVSTDDTGSSYGYGGYGYGGGGGGGNRNSWLSAFEHWYGVGAAPSGIIDQAMSEQWTPDQIRYYSLTHGANGRHSIDARDAVLASAAFVHGVDYVNSIDQTQINMLAGENLSDVELTNYFRDLPGGDIGKSPEAQNAIKVWTDATGIPLTYTARQRLKKIIDTYGGFTPEASAEWGMFVQNSDSAKAIGAPYGATKRAGIADIISGLLFRDPTAEELDPDGKFWNIADSPEAMKELLVGSDEYKAIYEYKPPWMDEGDFITTVQSFDALFRVRYGQRVTSDEGGLNLPDGFDPNDPRPKLFQYMTPEEFAFITTTGVTTGQLIQEWTWVEQRDYNRDTLNSKVIQVRGVGLTDEEWFAYTVPFAEGSGSLRALVDNAIAMTAFDEVFSDYTGHMPTPADYEYLQKNFVSPNQYAHRMAAKEDAAAQIESVNDLLGRVMGKSVSLAELENLAMGGKGSGALRAEIEQAAKLESYRWILKKYNNGQEPSPADYAGLAGYSGPEELSFELQMNEKMGEFAPDIKEVWALAYPEEQITDEMMYTMLGGTKGSGDLLYKWKKGQELQQEQEKARDLTYQMDRAFTPVSGAEGGGFQTSLPGLGDIGA